MDIVSKIFLFIVFFTPIIIFSFVFYFIFGGLVTTVFSFGISFLFFVLKLMSDMKRNENSRKRIIITGTADRQDFKTLDDYHSYKKFTQMLSVNN